MKITIKGANVHNLKNVDAEFNDGLTIVTGVSGSGKTSLVFDTLYAEARRRFLGVFSNNSITENITPVNVKSISGLCPSIALKQNLLNRNPNSILATASGLHPFLRLLFSHFGKQFCHECGNEITVLSKDEIIHYILNLSESYEITLYAPLVMGAIGSHKTLLEFLKKEFKDKNIFIDGKIFNKKIPDHTKRHNIYLELSRVTNTSNLFDVRKIIDYGINFGVNSFILKFNNKEECISCEPACSKCGETIYPVHPKYFHAPCPYCSKKGCSRCNNTGLHPLAANIKWNDLRIIDLLKLSVSDAYNLFLNIKLPPGSKRMRHEIIQRLETLRNVGLGYISLDRSSPTLSRGESQRLRLAVALFSKLEDIIHILDEPTIGLHPSDVFKLIPGFRQLGGPVIYIEHDFLAAIHADYAMDMGPGAGINGGNILFSGTPSELWKQNSLTGRYFSSRERFFNSKKRNFPKEFIEISKANFRNLKNIDVKIPLSRITVITGVSGSGKSTLIEDVLVASLLTKEPVGCKAINGVPIKPIFVNQDPIGKNPRSNPATYTKLADIIRDIFSSLSEINKSCFSFNSKKGACPECGGMGMIEIYMKFLPSTWITCSSCDGNRFSEEVIGTRITLGGKELSINELYDLSIDEVMNLFENTDNADAKKIKSALNILDSLKMTGLGYLKLGQPSTTLSGGEAQRIKLAKYLSIKNLEKNLIILDEPTTGLHPGNIKDLLLILNKLVDAKATIVIVEHNTDIIRNADWIIDLGPGAGPDGGNLIYQGDITNFYKCQNSITSEILNIESTITPDINKKAVRIKKEHSIIIKNAHANNLKNINVKIPKSAFTVITGVSGSGKSSLVNDILENEARHRFYESLSIYERYNTHEKKDVKVESINGLGITMSLGKKLDKRSRDIRSSVGTATEISHHIGVLFSFSGKRLCLKCQTEMERKNSWVCPKCGAYDDIALPHHFMASNYFSACRYCHGVGFISKPNPAKLIIHPEKPLCAGAMYSPGFFPQGYLCKPYNGGYYIVQAIAQKFGFDPFVTPWNEMDKNAQDAFLFGNVLLKVIYESKTGRIHTSENYKFGGFYGTWLRGDWDLHGTYTDKIKCPECEGSKLKPEYNAVMLGDNNINMIDRMSLKRLNEFISGLDIKAGNQTVDTSLGIIKKRLIFLLKVGLGYLNMNRLSMTLSAGEAQRIKLASLLGSDLTSLTILIDEPTRGLHPVEVDTLIECLKELKQNDNTVIVVEHEPLIIESADHVIDIGPGSGKKGGKIVFQGSPDQIKRSDSITGMCLADKKKFNIGNADVNIGKIGIIPEKWLILKGAFENNLRVDEMKIPYGMMTGICGVSGSGKSTLIIDTLGRILAPRKHTTSVSNEPLKPGVYSEIINPPERTIIIDQVINNITNPSDYLGITPIIEKIFADCDQSQISGIDKKLFRKCCSKCSGRGWIKMNMNFLPDIMNECEVCNGTGYPEEINNVILNGYSLPEIFSLTLDEVYGLFSKEKQLSERLGIAIETGLGYLVLHQPSISLSGGEVQRLKIACELCLEQSAGTFYILDEPTIGQHLEDVFRLIKILKKLSAGGNTVIIIEHHTHVLASCDWLIELGPGGGEEGGKIIFNGKPSEMIKINTPTSPYIKALMGGNI